LKRTFVAVIVGASAAMDPIPAGGCLTENSLEGGVPVSVQLPYVPGTPEDSAGARAAKVELLLARLVAQQASGLVGYWAAFPDERGVFHFAFTTNPRYADRSPENAASRARAVVALGRAIERHRAMVEPVRAHSRGR
jgi:hypothetical protein